MKAVVVEIREEFVAALCDDGCIVKVKNNNYAIGQVIEMKKQTTRKSKKLAIWAVSAVMLVIAGGTSVYAYVTPYSYVSLDVNPSIEYTLNQFDRVLSVEAVNDDGVEILEKIDVDNLTNQKIDDAVTLTVDQLSEDNYFDGDIEGGIVIATSAKDPNKAEELSAELQKSVEEDTERNGDTVEVEVLSVGAERVKQARELGVTPGKLNLVEKLKASATDPNSINLEEWLNKPVKEIMHATKENKKAEKENKAVIKEDKAAIKENNVSSKEDKTSSLEEKASSKEEKASSREQKASSREQKASSKEEKASSKEEKASSREEKSVIKEDKVAFKIEQKNKKV